MTGNNSKIILKLYLQLIFTHFFLNLCKTVISSGMSDAFPFITSTICTLIYKLCGPLILVNKILQLKITAKKLNRFDISHIN